ncbi:MAG: BlaI/MecI/CopY family transcriptional regulator [Armatimonadota bacterium]|nr:BlaI/MecI/CopY family transcriptional regulator [Armatimonadota bacterium]
MADKRDLPPSEFEVMRVIWEMGSATVRDVHDKLSKDRRLAYTSVSSLLGRLRDKGYVEVEERDAAYVYRPLVSQDQVVLRKVSDLVNRVLGGNLAPLASHIVRSRKLTPEQIRALEEIVNSEERRDD